MTLTDSPERPHSPDRRIAALVLAGLLLLPLVLRLWGFRTGLPYSYNRDENAHFVLYAISLFGHGWDPNYFDNPPALIYLLHLVFAVRFGGGTGAARAFATNPTAVFEVARLTSALLGAASVALVYVVGRQALGRGGALLAAAVLTVAFLPVSYGHLALNDALTILPVSLALLGAVLVVRSGRARDYALAGAGVGLAAATKYTGGIALLPVLAAVGVRFFGRPAGRRPALVGLAIALLAAVVAFAVVDPYALLRFGDLRDALHREALVAAGTSKLGVTEHSGLIYYLWTATWGLGWVPALLALAGAILLVRDDRRLAAVLHLAPEDGPLPFDDASIDLVWAPEVLEHVADTARRFLSEARRVLRSGGRLLVTTPARGRGRLLLSGPPDPLGDEPHLYTRRSLAARWRASGSRRCASGASAGRRSPRWRAGR